MSGHEPDPAGDLRQGVSAVGHVVLDKLDACRATWAARSRDDLRAELLLFVPAVSEADRVHGAALAIFLLEGEA